MIRDLRQNFVLPQKEKTEVLILHKIPVEQRFVTIPGGEFLMGCETGKQGERPIHSVTIYEFEMSAFQTTNRESAIYLDATGDAPPPCWNQPNFNDPDQPVVAVSWTMAMRYCEWLEKTTNRHCRLPTEAEWERAARGGREGMEYSWGNQPPSDWPEYRNRWEREVLGPYPVGQGTPNSYGLYDIGENVHEWCLDWFDENYYVVSPSSNPRGPEVGTRKASRGGSWRHRIKVSRCAARSSIPPEFEYADYGFRVVREF